MDGFPSAPKLDSECCSWCFYKAVVWVFYLKLCDCFRKTSEVITCDFSNWAPESGVRRVGAPQLLRPLSLVSQSNLRLDCCDWQNHHLWLPEATKWKESNRTYTQKQLNKRHSFLSVISSLQLEETVIRTRSETVVSKIWVT